MIKLKYLSIFFISCSIAMQADLGLYSQALHKAETTKSRANSQIFSPAGVRYLKLTLNRGKEIQDETSKIENLTREHNLNPSTPPHFRTNNIAGINSLSTLYNSRKEILKSNQWFLVIGSDNNERHVIDFFSPQGIPLSRQCDILWAPVLRALDAQDRINIWSLSNGDLKRSKSIYFQNEQSNRDKFLAFFKNIHKQQSTLVSKIDLWLAPIPYALLFVEDLHDISAIKITHWIALGHSILVALTYSCYESPRGIFTLFAQLYYFSCYFCACCGSSELDFNQHAANYNIDVVTSHEEKPNFTPINAEPYDERNGEQRRTDTASTSLHNSEKSESKSDDTLYSLNESENSENDLLLPKSQ